MCAIVYTYKHKRANKMNAYANLVEAGQQFIAAIEKYKVATNTVVSGDTERAPDWHIEAVKQVVSEVACE